MGKSKAAPAMEDPKEILAKIEEDRRIAEEEFNRKQQEHKEKTLAKWLTPLRETLAALIEKRKTIDSEITETERQIATLTGQDRKPKAKAGAAGKRVRRSEEQLKEAADAYVKALENAGQEGLSTSEILEKTGVEGKAGMSVSDFIKTYAGITIEKTGDKRSTRYYYKPKK